MIKNLSEQRPSRTPVWRIFLLAIALLVNLMLLWRLIRGPQSLISYKDLSTQHDALTQQIADLDKVNAGLTREIRLLQSDNKYVEKMIRHRLNFVKENEILYLFTEPEKNSAETKN